jgi:hypothetical protein
MLVVREMLLSLLIALILHSPLPQRVESVLGRATVPPVTGRSSIFHSMRRAARSATTPTSSKRGRRQRPAASKQRKEAVHDADAHRRYGDSGGGVEAFEASRRRLSS